MIIRSVIITQQHEYFSQLMMSRDLMVTMRLASIIIIILVTRARGQGQCDSDSDCQDPLPCCSQCVID